MKLIDKLPGFLKWFHWIKNDRQTCKKILFITLGSALQSVFLVLLMLSDTFIITHYIPADHAALNGAAIAISVFSLILFMTYSSNQGCNILIGQVKGAKDFNKVKELVRYKIVLSSIIVCAWITILKIVGEKQILSLVLGRLDITSSSNPNLRMQIIREGEIFLNWLLWSIIPFIFSLAIYSTSRVHGQIKVCVYSSIIALVVNIFLALLLVGGINNNINWGIKGVGIATLIARGVELLVLVFAVWWFKPQWNPGLNFWSISKWTLKRGLIFTLYLMISDVLFPLFLIVQQAVVARAAEKFNDPNILTAFNTVSISLDLFFSMLLGFYSVGPLYVGSRIAANNIQESKENAQKMLIVAFLLISITTIIAASGFWWWGPAFGLKGKAAYYCSWFMLGSAIGGIGFYGIAVQFLILLRSRGFIVTASLCEEPLNIIIYMPFLYFLFMFTNTNPAIILFWAPILGGLGILIFSSLAYSKFKWHKPIIESKSNNL